MKDAKVERIPAARCSKCRHGSRRQYSEQRLSTEWLRACHSHRGLDWATRVPHLNRACGERRRRTGRSFWTPASFPA